MVKHKITSILRHASSPPVESEHELSDKFNLSSREAETVAEILAEPVTDILNDLPTIEDVFGFKVLVRTLTNIASSDCTQTPLTICVDGEWGSGKTSFLKMIESQAKMLGFRCIWLNAWKLENIEQFFLTVADALLREFSLYDNALFEDEGERIFDEFSELRRYVWAWTESPLRVSFSEVFERLQKNDGRSSLSKNRLIVFVDDIDRAFPEQVVMILKNLKLILESSGCIFILAMDLDVVSRSLENVYINRSQSNDFLISNLHNEGTVFLGNAVAAREKTEIAKEFGYNYLEKLIQIHVKLPMLTRSIVNNYLKELGIIDEVIEIVENAPDEVLNPRRLKRYINWLSISLQLINSSPLPSSISSVDALRFMALQHDYPGLYDDLLNNRPINHTNNAFHQYISKMPYVKLIEFNKLLHEIPVLSAARLRA